MYSLINLEFLNHKNC